MAKDIKAQIDKIDTALTEVTKTLKKLPAVEVGKKPVPVDAKLLKEMAALAKAEAKLAKDVAALRKVAQDVMPAAISAHKSVINAVEAELSALLKAYQKAIKSTDGLTSQRPATAKALDKLTKDPGPDPVKAAVKELQAHKSEVVKQSGKDKAKKKAVGDFGKAIDKMCADLAKM